MEGWQVGRQRRAVPGPQHTEPTAASVSSQPQSGSGGRAIRPVLQRAACHSRRGQMCPGSLAPHTSHSTECPGGLLPSLPFPQLCSTGVGGEGWMPGFPHRRWIFSS